MASRASREKPSADEESASADVLTDTVALSFGAIRLRCSTQGIQADESITF
jgi:hypothetical protein